MTWPLSQDYNEAIQGPSANFADAELRRGEAAANALGLPMPYSGNFADVYQVRCPGGARWAVKCFTREAPGLRERYAEIDRHLRKAKLPFTVDFTYLEKGIRVAGQWYPVLKMQWVEGLTLNQFVAQHLDKPAMLEALSQIWRRMGQYLRAAEVGHCDLQHGNVLLVPGSGPNSLALKLIDYDGMWVPALAGRKSGEVGHPCYQHPQRLREGIYSPDVDRFPLLLVATALRALKTKGKTLWDAYDNGDNMLFKEADLQAPLQSRLLLDLTRTGDEVVNRMMGVLVESLRGRLDTVPLLDDVLPESRPAAAQVRAGRPQATPPPAGIRSKPAGATADALNFDDPAAGVVSPSMRGKASVRSRRRGLPVAALAGGGAALVVVAGAAVALAAWALSARAGNHTPAPAPTPVAHVDNPQPKDKDRPTPPKDPNGDPQQSPAPPDGAAPMRPAGSVPASPPRPSELPGSPYAAIPDARLLRIGADGKRAVVLAANGMVIPIDLDAGAALDPYAFKDLKPTCLALAPDGNHAYFGTASDEFVHELDLGADAQVRRLTACRGPAGQGLACLDLSPDGKRLIAVATDGTFCVWEDDKGKWADGARWKAFGLAPLDAHFLADGARAVTLHGEPTVRCWDVKTGEQRWSYPGQDGAKPVAIGSGADAKHIPVGLTDGLGVLCDAAKPGGLPYHAPGRGPVKAVALSTDGSLFAMSYSPADGAAGPSGVVVWSVQPKGGVRILECPPVRPECLAFAPDGRRLYAVCDDGKLHGWPVEGGAKASPDEAPALSFESGAGWDRPVRPGGDCFFYVNKNALTIKLPPGDHDLAVEHKQMNAPRLLRDVEGDFTAQVRVGGEFNPSGPSTPAGRPTFVGAGLVVMDGDQTYAWLERHADSYQGQVRHFGDWLLRQDGELVPYDPKGNYHPVLPNQPIYLKLERKGKQLLASVSPDGAAWFDLPAYDVKLPARVKVGVAATSTSTGAFEPRFEDVRLTVGEAKPEVKPPVTVTPGKRTPPGGDALAMARDKVRAKYKDDYDDLNVAKDQAKEAYDLSGKLLAEARLAKDDTDQQYALFVEARDLAARGENLAACFQIIDETGARYAIDEAAARRAALQAVGKTFSPAAAKAYLDAVTPILQQARAEDDYDAVAPLVPLARQAGFDVRDAEAAKPAAALAAEWDRLKTHYDAIKPALETLKDKPDDPGANLEAGKFYCFEKHDWDKGAPLLAKGSNAGLSLAASKEVTPPADAAAQAEAGKAWADQADAAAGAFREAIQRRAYYWYVKSLSGALDKDVEPRVFAQAQALGRQFPEGKTAWESLDVSRAEVVGDAFFRLKSGQAVAVKTPLTGPVEVTVVARSPHGGDLSFELYQSKDILSRINVRGAGGSIYSYEKGKMDKTIPGFAMPKPVGEWNTYVVQITESAVVYSVNGKTVHTQTTKPDLGKRTIELRNREDAKDAGGGLLDVKSLTVTLLKP